MLCHGRNDPEITEGWYNEKTLSDISYEFLGYRCFSLCCYESEKIASMVNFYHLMARCILQLSWTAASCKHLRSDFNNFFHMNFNKSSKMASKSAQPTGECQARFCSLYSHRAVFSCTWYNKFNVTCLSNIKNYAMASLCRLNGSSERK